MTAGRTADDSISATGGEDEDRLEVLLRHVRGAGLAFNTPLWAGIVADCYGFEDCSLRSGAASLPLFASWSPLFGRKLSSAVFNSYASPIYETDEQCVELVREAVARAEARRAGVLELKSLCELPPEIVARFGFAVRRRYRATVVDLRLHRPELGSYGRNFRSHLRRAYRRLAEAGVSVGRTEDPLDVRRFHRLMLRRYRDKHRMIGQPLRLFELVRRRLMVSGEADLWVARKRDGELIAGMLVLVTPAVVTAAFGSSSAAYGRLSPDAVLKDAALDHYARRGHAVFDLGLSSRKQPQLLFAKSRFGGITFDAPFYYRPRAGGKIPELDFADAYAWLRGPFRAVPLPLVGLLSARLVRYLN